MGWNRADDYGAELTRVNEPGLSALREYLTSGQAVAFLGAGVSAPLYPLWVGLIGDLVDAAAGRMSEEEAVTCRALATESPEEVVEIIRQQLGVPAYREVLRQVLRARTDPETGRSWTPVQELVCRCGFKAVVTANYDPGITDARIRVRPGASSTGFTTWEDELGLDRWRTGDVFGESELPVLFAHGQQNRPDSVVLATTEYRRAYAGKLPHVLARLMDGHLVWIGFSFADQRIAAILREIADRTGTRIDPGAAPRHVAVMSWDPAEASDPSILARRAEIAYSAKLVLYPAPDGDHSALARLLADLTDARFPPAADLPARAAPAPPAPPVSPGIPVRWVPDPERVEHFTGRAEELARLDRWAADRQVTLVGVTAWGGAGKTSLVTHWVEAVGTSRRPGLRGMFGWSFYADPSAEHWATSLLEWAEQEFRIRVAASRPAAAILGLVRKVPLLLVLDGLERVQQGPVGADFGRLLDGTLREVLAGACQLGHGGLVLLTSRFPFADLETFDGGAARMLEVPPFTPAEGSALLAAVGGSWLPDRERHELVRAVDGHALAIGVLAGLLADHPPTADLQALRAELDAAARTDARVAKVLEFYADRLAGADRYLLAAVSLFARPVPPDAIIAVAAHEAFGGRLAGWTPTMIEAAVRDRLGGLASWHHDGTISAHPLVHDTFRRLVLDAAGTAAETSLAGLPAGTVTSRADALRVVEAIELLLDVGQWQPADDIDTNRTGVPPVWLTLPAMRLGQRAFAAFVATPDRRAACAIHLPPDRLGYYLAGTGLFAMAAGDLAMAQEYLHMTVRHYRDVGPAESLSIALRNLAECLDYLGQTGAARDAAAEALTFAEAGGDRAQVHRAHVSLAWAAVVVGDAAEAEQHFTTADQIQIADDQESDHLYSLSGTDWGDWLARTARLGPAQVLITRNAEICRSYGWNDDLARCDHLLGRLALAAGDTVGVGEHLEAAAGVFRDGDFLTELATTLTDLASWSQVAGDLDAAERHVTEAITIAAPRGLMPAQSAALAARARIRAARADASGDPDPLYQGRDAADAALHLATRHHLAWHELDALRAHALLDQAEGVDRGWAAKADALHAWLVPPGLDPDPLATVERLVAEQRAADPDSLCHCDVLARRIESRRQRPADQGRQVGGHAGQLAQVGFDQGLRPVAQRAFRMRVHVHDDAVGANRDRGPGQRHHQVPAAAGMRGVHDDWQV
jgi:tetratricopeptide (TPR) repeat protein